MQKGLEYAKFAVKSAEVPVYVKKQAKEFIEIAEGKNKKYVLSKEKTKQLEGILKLLNMPKGLKMGCSLYECSTGYQWLLYTASLCIVYRDNEEKRRYETCLLEISRKNFKTFTVATVFILLLLLEPQFSKFYSVAPDGALSKEVREAVSEILKCSPLVYEYNGDTRFKILRDYIEFKLKNSKYIPLNYSTSRMDGRLPNAFVADEVGALPNSYAIEAMRSGQLNILNKLGFIISTKYPTIDNPFEDEVAYCKKILDGVIEDETVFSLLYEPDNTEAWMTDDIVLKQANPASMEIAEIWEDLLKKRARAIEMESARENFLTKHCNIIYQGAGTETFVDINHVQACKVDNIDWEGREVYIGVDLSMTSDNTAVAMVADDEGTIISEVIGFIPEGRINEKNQSERVDYRRFINQGKCIACGDLTIDYSVVEQFVFDIEKRYKCHVVAIGYDRYNCLSSAQKWDELYTTTEIRQHSSVLHSPTKLLAEKITNKQFAYVANDLLEINFQNSRCVYDTNMNRYVNKKKSNGKIDMVVALINATFLLEQDVYLNSYSFVVQTM